MKIHPHGRLQEWVADEKGYFTDEGLEYDFAPESQVLIGSDRNDSGQIKNGAYETYEDGRDTGISCACHWAVNTAAMNQIGKLVNSAYSVTPSAILVAPDSDISRPEDLGRVDVGVGYHSGSHFATLQALEAVLPKERIRLDFEGSPRVRLDSLLDGQIPAATLFGVEYYIALEYGFRPILDTTFMVAFLTNNFDDNPSDVEKYFNGLKRAQMELDLHGERYKHYYTKAMPEKYLDRVDVRRFGPGERIVFLPYTGETYESTQQWIQERDIFEGSCTIADYDSVVVSSSS